MAKSVGSRAKDWLNLERDSPSGNALWWTTQKTPRSQNQIPPEKAGPQGEYSSYGKCWDARNQTRTREDTTSAGGSEPSKS